MKEYIKQLKFLVMDVDGTLTDGKIYMGLSGELLKAFDAKDGYAIKEMLPLCGMTPIVITARKSAILEKRCEELGIAELHQGVRDKYDKLEKILESISKRDKCAHSLANVVYIGDDSLDLQCMVPVRNSGGLVACPLDAVQEVKQSSDFICTKRGGDGAVRELVEYLFRVKRGKGLKEVGLVSEMALKFIENFNPSKIPDGWYNLDEGVRANVMTYMTSDASMTCFEAHKRYIDIQYLVYGSEIIVVQQTRDLVENVFAPYSKSKDLVLFNSFGGQTRILEPGESIILFPNDAHRGAISVSSDSTRVRKIVIKVPINFVSEQ